MGVQTVVDSVMTFRVRFTAKFGRQGIIQRKAFEMITDALAKKGIHYAHRKVIVELPHSDQKASGAVKFSTPHLLPIYFACWKISSTRVFLSCMFA